MILTPVLNIVYFRFNRALAKKDKVLDQRVYGDCDDASKFLNPNHLPHLDGTDVRQAREEVLTNAVMDSNGGVVSEYAELVIQFAFTTLFACAFPGGPAIVLAINVATDAGQFWQAGICLIAAAGAFGSLGFVFGKTEG